MMPPLHPALAFCTDYRLCNALGPDREQILRRLSLGQTGLHAPSFELPFGTYVGELSTELAPLPLPFAGYESRLARIGYALAAAMESSIHAALRRWGKRRVALVLATSTGGLSETECSHLGLGTGLPLPPGYGLLRTHGLGATLELLQQVLGTAGPAFVISTACSSSAKALASAQRLIQSGVADAVIAGGLDTLCQTTLFGFQALGILSTERCKPFATARNGINIGEGGALILLEREADSEIALLGCGESSDAYHLSAPDPEGHGAERAMRQALQQAQVSPHQVGYVNAHGTGTPQNDAAEALALARVFGMGPSVVSTKSYTGHLLGAAGATEAAFCIAALEQGQIPANLGADSEDSLGIRLGRETLQRDFKFALTNSFAFGGSNVSLLFGKVAR